MENLSVFEKPSLSLWLKDGLSSTIPALAQDMDCEVCVVGAGITGIMTAYQLHEAGLKVVLVDKQEPVHLASGNTTAKFTFQHDLIYSDIIKNYDLNTAKLYYESQVEGLNLVRSLINKHNIACDFKETSAVIYAENEKKFEELLEEKSAYEQLHIPHEIIYDLPLNLEGKGGLKVDSQFELNPVKFLDFLISHLLKNGVSVFKNTEAKKMVKEDESIKIETADEKVIRCNKLVLATAYPVFESSGFYFTRLEALRSYLLAFAIQQPLDDHYMLISHSSSPYSLRFSYTDGVHYLLVGGQGHKVGQADSEMDSNQRLLEFARAQFGVDEPAFRWSAQDYRSVDNIPYIGKLTDDDENIFVATGFNKWGMTKGSFSSILITDLITGKPSRYEELYNPARGEVKSNLGSFVKANLNVAKELVKGKILPDEINLEDIQNDQGGIIKYKGKRVAAYRDDAGKLYLSDSTCTHLGCELEYNDAERSFDCPCHGSRFNYDGKVIEGVAKTDLKKIE